MAFLKSLIPTIITTTFLFAVHPSFAQVAKDPDTTWGSWKFLVGEWAREENGQPDLPEVKFSFVPDLKGKVLIRRGNAEEPDTGRTRRPQEHGDIMIVYLTNSNHPSKAIYFDDKGRTINYSVSVMDNGNIVFTSPAIDKSPRYRLTYMPLKSDMIRVKIESSPPGKSAAFALAYEGNCLRIK